MNDIQITDAELEIMKVLWSEGTSLISSDIRSKLNKNWERTTVLTLLSRLSDKGAISIEKGNRSYRYKSLISKEEYGLNKTRSILDNLYNGSIKGMMAALCDSQGLTEQEIRELQEILDKDVK